MSAFKGQWLPSKEKFMSIFRGLSSETKEGLCSTCSSLDLRALPHSDELIGFDNEDVVPLGTIEEVLTRQRCPVCSLVLHLVFDRVAADHRQDGSAPNYPSRSISSQCVIRRKKHVFEVLDQFGLQGFICSASRTALPDQALTDLEYAGVSFGRQLKIPLVRDWIRACETQHPSCGISRSPWSARDPINLTLIDVRSSCLVETTLAERYLALSYVWGEVRMLQTTKANRDALHAARALLEQRNQIPQAIQDAMTLVSLLNERFLWVDSLCIVQDDKINKHEQIQRMNVVYGHAFLTIVAMSGRDANCPLPGVAFHSRPQLFAVADIARNRLISRPLKIKHLIQSSPYESRAWTYQERLSFIEVPHLDYSPGILSLPEWSAERYFRVT